MKFSFWKQVLTTILMGIMAVVPAMALSGCTSAQWVATLDTILAQAAPALVNVYSIIQIAENKPVDAAFVAKINQDAATVKALSADFAAASAAAAPTACAQLQAAISVYSQDQAEVMALLQVSNPAVQSKVGALVILISGVVVEVLALIPACKTAAGRASLEAQGVPLPLKQFVQSYNNVLVVPTGNAAVDSFTKSHKLHQHNKFFRGFVRVVSFDQARVQ